MGLRNFKNNIFWWINKYVKKLQSYLHSGIHNINWRYRKQACFELFERYKQAWQFWWNHREQIKAPDLRPHEAEFLPSALAIQDAPVSPAGRLVARVLISLLAILLLWAVTGKMDIIVSGQGKIIPSGNTKAISSVEVAKVVGLYVQEGQIVKAGELLIELDSRGPDSDQNKAQGDRQLALLQIQRSKALMESISTNKEPTLGVMDGINDEYYQNELKHLQDSWRDYIAKRNRILSQIKRFSDALPIATQKAKDYLDLSKGHDVSIHSYMEKEQARIEVQGQLDDAKTQLASLASETRKAAQSDLYQATRIWSGAVQDINKANAHSEQLRLVSPVDGVVQQLSVHTVGGVVPAAQPLMLVVPIVHTIEVEAYVENRDIGFVKEGQNAKIKIEAYDYTKYGTIAAIVSNLSRDAIDISGNGIGSFANQDNLAKNGAGNKGLMYAVRLALNKSNILVNGKEMPLTPGMSVGVEIKTGERRIIEYVLSPLIRHANESLRER